MKTTSCTTLILLIGFTFCCGAMSIDLNKETPNTGTTAELNRKIKRSTDELDNLLNEIVSDEELLNLAIHGVDKEKVQNSALLQYLLLRKPIHILQEKRSLDYRPRLGRRSNEDTEQPKPYDVFFTPRMGKRADFTNYTPRLGRSTYSE
ncbi:uncharacterized protein LOC129567471 isoform X2 [Sitodiplosis mosellana]|uniref:uncharacterized protein LOC129567471 isoform X2 n=1 Tax=Sitodiplosis mosellana TaxID=263140 RepID=UPI0024444EA8|nr:uncharacterized protein LOC129567471 isoform X2 [Sitodiplosis mosellana]